MGLAWVLLMLSILPVSSTKRSQGEIPWSWLFSREILMHAQPELKSWHNTFFSTDHDLHYIGCFKDSDPRDLPQRVHAPDLNARICVHKCKDLEFKYAGLQFSYLCFCGNTYGRYGELPEDKCSSECESKRDSFCGGHWSNSVYDTGERESSGFF